MPKRGNNSSLLDKMRARLSGGHFRMLNEKLYTCSGEDVFDYFKNDPNLFDVDAKNKMSILFYFRKKEKSKVAKSIDWPQLKPCLYKRR